MPFSLVPPEHWKGCAGLVYKWLQKIAIPPMLLFSPPQIILLYSLESLKPLVGKTERYTLYCATSMGFAGVTSVTCLSATMSILTKEGQTP